MERNRKSLKELSLDDYPVKKEEIAYRVIDEEIIFLNLESAVYYSANEVGAMIWELCDGRRSIKDIVQVICAEYEVKKEEAEKDVLEFINDLRQEGFLLFHEQPLS